MILDSSVYASIVVVDEFYEKAKNVLKLASREKAATVNIVFSEVANVLWKHVFLFKRIDAKEIKERLCLFLELVDKTSRIFSSRDLLNEAVEIATKYGLSVYDSLYLSLAIRFKCKLYTFDLGLRDRLSNTDLREIILIP